MADHALEDPVVARARELELREGLARALDNALAGVRLQVQRIILERFEQLVAAQVVDRVLLQLVREAYAHFEDPESPVDINEWVKTARGFVRGEGDR